LWIDLLYPWTYFAFHRILGSSLVYDPLFHKYDKDTLVVQEVYQPKRYLNSNYSRFFLLVFATFHIVVCVMTINTIHICLCGCWVSCSYIPCLCGLWYRECTLCFNTSRNWPKRNHFIYDYMRLLVICNYIWTFLQLHCN